jgi:hypothetical protein
MKCRESRMCLGKGEWKCYYDHAKSKNPGCTLEMDICKDIVITSEEHQKAKNPGCTLEYGICLYVSHRVSCIPDIHYNATAPSKQ